MLFSGSSYTSLNQEKGNKIILLPLGAIEQHGPHLAVATDTDIITEIAKSAESIIPDLVLLCPTLAFGSSDHHLAFGGTISISPELYTSVIIDLVTSLVSSG